MTDHRLREDNQRRVARMNVWIESATTSPADDDYAHIRFVFYWIAYEAAYKVESDGFVDGEQRTKEWAQREQFHRSMAGHDGEMIQGVLRRHRDRIARLLELRQADSKFWYQGNQNGQMTEQEWEIQFNRRVTSALRKLNNGETETTLNNLFRNLAVVRNQIVHGGSAGTRSRGRTQVLLGAELLSALIPRFRDVVQSNLDEDWGNPPFPRVGTGPDDTCPPPWLDHGRRSKR